MCVFSLFCMSGVQSEVYVFSLLFMSSVHFEVCVFSLLFMSDLLCMSGVQCKVCF